MTIEELCAKFDSSLVVDSGELLNKTYKSSSDKIYTDGDILNTKIDNNGNIVIEGLDNAKYKSTMSIPSKKSQDFKKILERININRRNSSK